MSLSGIFTIKIVQRGHNINYLLRTFIFIYVYATSLKIVCPQSMILSQQQVRVMALFSNIFVLSIKRHLKAGSHHPSFGSDLFPGIVSVHRNVDSRR